MSNFLLIVSGFFIGLMINGFQGAIGGLIFTGYYSEGIRKSIKNLKVFQNLMYLRFFAVAILFLSLMLIFEKIILCLLLAILSVGIEEMFGKSLLSKTINDENCLEKNRN
jgi:hypothetical protein